jgi:hypothetical protein
MWHNAYITDCIHVNSNLEVCPNLMSVWYIISFVSYCLPSKGKPYKYILSCEQGACMSLARWQSNKVKSISFTLICLFA